MQLAISAILCLRFFVFVSFWIKGQDAKVEKPAVVFHAASQFANTQVTYKFIPAANNTFYYDMLADGKILIHQPSNPGLTGNEGFKTKADAEKVAKFIFNKI